MFYLLTVVDSLMYLYTRVKHFTQFFQDFGQNFGLEP